MAARRFVIWLALVSLALPAQAGPTRYDPRRAGHPVRIAAYALHPVGVILDTLIFHPAWWIGQHEPLRTLFGVQSEQDDGMEVRVRHAEPAPESDTAPSEPDED